MADVKRYVTAFQFRGKKTTITQIPREKEAGDDNTGWCLWEASNVLMRFLADDQNLRELFHDDVEWPSLRILDFSAGAGLVTLASAAAGATVVSCDIPSQLPQLELNVRDAAVTARVIPFLWGQPTDALAAAVSAASDAPRLLPPYDLVLASDIVFIAIRDGLTGPLAASLVDLAGRQARYVLFVFEEVRSGVWDIFHVGMA